MAIERDEFNFDAPAPVGHPARRGLPDDHGTGPEVGERLPAFTLPDAFGKPFEFDPGDGGSPFAVVFYRSAVW